MLYHYALLPDVFRPELLAKRPSVQVILKQLLRGLCENGLVANLHADAWSRHVQTDLLPNLPPQMKDQVQACLKRLMDNHRLVTLPPAARAIPAAIRIGWTPPLTRTISTNYTELFSRRP